MTANVVVVIVIDISAYLFFTSNSGKTTHGFGACWVNYEFSESW